MFYVGILPKYVARSVSKTVQIYEFCWSCEEACLLPGHAHTESIISQMF